jgi:hypothetical protein
VVEEAMQNVFGMSPHDLQQDAIHHIITLAKDNPVPRFGSFGQREVANWR